jgi:hypothetical protein
MTYMSEDKRRRAQKRKKHASDIIYKGWHILATEITVAATTDNGQAHTKIVDWGGR